MLGSDLLVTALEEAASRGWGNYMYPSTAQRQACLVNATSCHPPNTSPRIHQLGSRGTPNPGFLLFVILYVGHGPVDNGTLFMTVFVFFLIVNGEIVCRSLLHRDVSSIQTRASPGFVRCLSMLLRKIKKEINQMYL